MDDSQIEIFEMMIDGQKDRKARGVAMVLFRLIQDLQKELADLKAAA